MSTFPEESRKIASDIVEGFQEAVEQIEDLNMEDMDEAYNILYSNLMNQSSIKGVQSQSSLAAITIAKFFLEKFQYVPHPALALIDADRPNPSPPVRGGVRHHQPSRTSSTDSNETSRPQQSPAPSSNHIELSSAPRSSSSLQRVSPPSHASSIQAAVARGQAAISAGVNPLQAAASLSEQELLLWRQGQIQLQHAAAQIQVAAAVQAAQTAQMAAANAHSHHHPMTVQSATNGSRLGATTATPTTIQPNLTVYGPHGQAGIHTQYTPQQMNLAAASMAVAAVTAAARQSAHGGGRPILPRPAVPSPTSAASPAARHNLPLQVQPQRQPFR